MTSAQHSVPRRAQANLIGVRHALFACSKGSLSTDSGLVFLRGAGRRSRLTGSGLSAQTVCTLQPDSEAQNPHAGKRRDRSAQCIPPGWRAVRKPVFATIPVLHASGRAHRRQFRDGPCRVCLTRTQRVRARARITLRQLTRVNHPDQVQPAIVKQGTKLSVAVQNFADCRAAQTITHHRVRGNGLP